MSLIQKSIVDAPSILIEAHRCIGARASERDQESERSMARTVASFNAMYGCNLSVEAGWAFMVLLKMSRSVGGGFKMDDYIDGAAYFALMGEEALNERNTSC